MTGTPGGQEDAFHHAETVDAYPRLSDADLDRIDRQRRRRHAQLLSGRGGRPAGTRPALGLGRGPAVPAVRASRSTLAALPG